ncbi:pH-response regulator protein palH/RIM21 [Penicillium verhagenii]|uniref:pH-response regulator protein palH/RIM21 n=1 Tax=Penicillium verhagenii TaxID=1562060 RepID=UPI00254543D3|nr:pH-response regulator protein palH/RIM21 [Penicillium verhagenii]KAJ5939049.1 pH-response regulator protein palH/RIM21 [Penicillium verhagenii]
MYTVCVAQQCAVLTTGASSLTGIIHVNKSYELTLTANAVFEPICTDGYTDYTHVAAVLDTRDPFYSSVTPQLYAIGCCTVVSYVLVIILLITPRTFFVGGPGGGGENFLGRHSMISRSYSRNSSIVGIGGRPWLQKVAAFLVAISLTIATVDSFRVAEIQYEYGYSDAEALSEEVIDGMEIRIVRVISQTFLWLAQVQTLIRLFPRHKEKVMIKWAGFALIVLDTIFSILESFFFKNSSTHPRLYDDAIPALSYLFELALNLLYAAWVIFYSISKHRYAFFHPKMRNICFVALLSLCAVLIPVVFFVMDIAKPEIAGWGTYIRWVGSAAASVVVWEWVERIEALERDETKDGILGREVFDGDEMLEVTPSEEVDWPRYSPHGQNKGGGNGASSGWGGVMNLAHRPLRTRVGTNRGNRARGSGSAPPPKGVTPSRRQNNHRPTPPPAVITPVSRADTSSAPSTVYNVRYHPVASPTPPVAMPNMEEEEAEIEEEKEIEIERYIGSGDVEEEAPAHDGREQSPQMVHADPRWRNLINHFKRRRGSLPREVAFAQAGDESADEDDGHFDDEDPEQHTTQTRSNNNFFSLHRPRLSGAGPQSTDAPLAVTVIPARRRGQQTWSPQPRNSLLEATETTSINQHEQPRPGQSNLPVRVIPSQPHASAPWGDADLEHGDGNYVLRYDPEAAALVHERVSHSQGEPAVAGNRASWTATTVSEADSDQVDEPQAPQHHDHDHTSS